MKHGDISNRESPILAFNIDNLLFMNKPKRGLLNKLIFKISPHSIKYLLREPNKEFIKCLDVIWDKFNYSVYLVTKENFIEDIESLLSSLNVCYTKLINYESKEYLRTLCQNRFSYYFDADLETLSYISSNKAVHIKDLWMKVSE